VLGRQLGHEADGTGAGGGKESPGCGDLGREGSRQREGIAKAKAEGKYKGRPASIDAAEIRRLTATMGPAAIAKHLGIARSSVYRMLEQPAADTQH
jgi:hypothetical protein